MGSRGRFIRSFYGIIFIYLFYLHANKGYGKANITTNLGKDTDIGHE